MNYKPEIYWQERGKNYKAKEVDSELSLMLDRLMAHLPTNIKVVEVGSGYGRIYDFLKDYYDITLYDFVKSMRLKCKANTGVLPRYWDGKKLPCSTNQFDLLILFDVLLHVPEKDIESFIKETTRAAKYTYIATYFTGQPHSPPHVFEHDYYKLLNSYKILSDDTIKRPGKVNNTNYTAIRKHWLISK